jgi:hypothetical protein
LTSFRSALLCLVTAGAIGASSNEALAEDYSFSIAEFEKQPYEWGGFFEGAGTQLFLDDAAALRARSLPGTDDALAHQGGVALDLEGVLRSGTATLHGRLRALAEAGELGYAQRLTVQRLSLASQPVPQLNLEAGKTSLRWGKGYSFNPVAFVDRPKDPGDPEEALEGFVLATAELTRSFAGPLQTLALTVAVLPVHAEVNADFGLPGHENFAAKLYLLLWDMDVDVLALAGDSRGTRFGVDWAYNLTPDFEVHAEAALLPEASTTVLAAGQPPRATTSTAWQGLLGVRYLSARETTYIAEYLYNGLGLSPAQLELFYELPVTPPATNLAGEAAAPLASPYRAPFPMRHYAYLRVSQKDACGWLDFSPALTGIANLVDGSFSVTPELLYRGITNLELRLRAAVLVGGEDSDFGERAQDARVELRVRHFF